MIGRVAGLVPEILFPDIFLAFTAMISLRNLEVILSAATGSLNT
jgi:hypothetical protein